MTSGSTSVFRPAPTTIGVTIPVEKRVYDNVAKRAGTLGIKPSEYFRRLVDAAWHARVCDERGSASGDAALDRAVKDVFLLADCEPEFIAETLGLPKGWVEKIIRAWKGAGAHLALDPALRQPPPDPSAARSPSPPAAEDAPKTLEGAGEKPGGRGAARSPAEVETIRKMWRAGAKLQEIAAATGRTYMGTASWISAHPEICPKRRGK